MNRSIALTIHGPSPILRGYPYFWIKAVLGFDPSNHCAKCLRGPFLKTTKQKWHGEPGERVAYEMPAEALALYVCGVTTRGWATNFHLPLWPRPDVEPFTVSMVLGQSITVENAEALTIPELADGYRGYSKAFTTCRNWRFGVALFGEPPLLRPDLEDPCLPLSRA